MLARHTDAASNPIRRALMVLDYLIAIYLVCVVPLEGLVYRKCKNLFAVYQWDFE